MYKKLMYWIWNVCGIIIAFGGTEVTNMTLCGTMVIGGIVLCSYSMARLNNMI